MGNTACCKEAEEPMSIVATCVRDQGHERALSKLGRNLELLQGAQDGDVKRVSHALHDGAEPEIRQAFVLFGRDRTLDDIGPEGRVQPARPRGPTALMLAAKSGSVACLQMLLEFRANVAAEDEDGLRPIHYAAMSGEISTLACLINAGADVLQQDDLGNGVLEHLNAEVKNDVLQFRRWESAVMPEQCALGKDATNALDKEVAVASGEVAASSI